MIEMVDVSKRYTVAGRAFHALRDIDLTVNAGEFVAIVGKSGSGKSTLINVLTGIDTPTSGQIRIGSTAVHTLDEEGLAVWRGRHVGIVFQFFQLLPTLTIAENVMLPMDFCNTCPTGQRRERALGLLRKLGIEEQADKLRAPARPPPPPRPLLGADEPTGNLDSATSDEVMGLFASLAREGKTVVMVSHERDLGRHVSRIITLVDGAMCRGSGAGSSAEAVA
jgi:putative ABC transport system ATP-binding protein